MKAASNIIYMFPGLGAEYPGMLAAFCKHYPWAESVIKNWESSIDFPLLNYEPESARDKEFSRQLQIHCLNLLWWKLAKPQADSRVICCGHSLGFYASLVAAGVLSETDSWFWLRSIFNEGWQEFHDNPNRIIVLTTSVAIDANRLAKQFNVEMIVRNSSLQVVIYGQPENIAKMCNALSWAVLRYRDLRTVIPFHSAVMNGVCNRMLELGINYRNHFDTSRYELWSHLTGEPLRSGETIFQTLLEQPMRSVNWQRLIQNLCNRYQPEFIEIGPNRILNQLVRWINPTVKVNYIDHIRKRNQLSSGELI